MRPFCPGTILLCYMTSTSQYCYKYKELDWSNNERNVRDPYLHVSVNATVVNSNLTISIITTVEGSANPFVSPMNYYAGLSRLKCTHCLMVDVTMQVTEGRTYMLIRNDGAPQGKNVTFDLTVLMACGAERNWRMNMSMTIVGFSDSLALQN